LAPLPAKQGRILKEGNKSLSIASDEEIQTLIAQNFSPTCPLDASALWLEWKFVIQPQGIALGRCTARLIAQDGGNP
jgi:hypothetical protein